MIKIHCINVWNCQKNFFKDFFFWYILMSICVCICHMCLKGPKKGIIFPVAKLPNLFLLWGLMIPKPWTVPLQKEVCGGCWKEHSCSAQDSGVVPSTRWQLTSICYSGSTGPEAFFWHPQGTHMYTYIHLWRQHKTLIYIKNIKNIFF